MPRSPSMVIHQLPTKVVEGLLREYVEAFDSGWRPNMHIESILAERVEQVRYALGEIDNWRYEHGCQN